MQKPVSVLLAITFAATQGIAVTITVCLFSIIIGVVLIFCEDTSNYSHQVELAVLVYVTNHSQQTCSS